jgi:hypothetical protein
MLDPVICYMPFLLAQSRMRHISTKNYSLNESHNLSGKENHARIPK